MTTQCGFCKGTGKEEGFDGCVWCCNTGLVDGLSAEVVPNLKPFRFLPYGAKFRYRGTADVWVRTGHNLVAEWPSRVSVADGTPIQSLCCFCHLDEDGDTLDTLVEVVDHEFERDAALGREAALIDKIATIRAEHDDRIKFRNMRCDALQQRLTAADERADVLEADVREKERLLLKCMEAFNNCVGMSSQATRSKWYEVYLKPASGSVLVHFSKGIQRALGRPAESDDTTIEEDREDFKKVFVRTNTKQGQSISLADMMAKYEPKP